MLHFNFLKILFKILSPSALFILVLSRLFAYLDYLNISRLFILLSRIREQSGTFQSNCDGEILNTLLAPRHDRTLEIISYHLSFMTSHLSSGKSKFVLKVSLRIVNN